MPIHIYILYSDNQSVIWIIEIRRFHSMNLFKCKSLSNTESLIRDCNYKRFVIVELSFATE